jgi:hypothetical protein
MTVGEALERAEQLRPNCRIETETRLQWLREADALLRTKLFDRAAAGAFDAVGADRPWEQPVQDDQRTPTQPEQLGKPVQDKAPAPTLSQKLTGTLDSLLFGKNESAAEPDAAVSNQKK